MDTDDKKMSTLEYLVNVFKSVPASLPVLVPRLPKHGPTKKRVSMAPHDKEARSKKRRQMAARSNQINRKRCHRWKN